MSHHLLVGRRFRMLPLEAVRNFSGHDRRSLAHHVRDMRATLCLIALVAAAPAFLAASSAQAHIKPLPRPTAPVAATHVAIAPVARPATHTVRPVGRTTPLRARRARPHRHARAAPRRHHTARRRHHTARPRRHRVHLHVLARNHGGRDVPLLTYGGRGYRLPAAAPVPVPLAAPEPAPPIPLGIGQVLPASGTTWPAWVLAPAGALVAGEATLLLRLARRRRLRTGV
jgi:hypothetical protein